MTINALLSTLGNETWMRENMTAIKRVLPATWTDVRNLNQLQIMIGLKMIGIDFRSQEEFAKILAFLAKVGILQMAGTRETQVMVRVAP